MIAQPICRKYPSGDARMIDDDLPEHPRGLESPEGHPEGVLDLGTDHNTWTRGQREYKWSDDDRSGNHPLFERNFNGPVVAQFATRCFQRGSHPGSRLLTPSS